MVIANPIYDAVFKRMMENERVAKFFIGTLLDEQIESVSVQSQEFTFIKKLNKEDPEVREYIRQRLKERITINVMRLDFVAIIRTKEGELRKVLIEIQKAKRQIDLMRFRSYLAEQYQKQDVVDGEEVALPVTTIYILGFKLPEIETSCMKVDRVYRDLIGQAPLTAKSDFVEGLTHDSYVVQVERITGRYHTSLDKLLSVFEQDNFVDNRKIIKEYTHNTDLEEVRLITEILHHAGTDPAERKEIENEQEGWRTIDALFANDRKNYEKTLAERNKAIAELDKALTKKDQALVEKDQALVEKDQALVEKDQALVEKDQALVEKDQALVKKDQALAERNNALEEMARQLEELKRKLGES